MAEIDNSAFSKCEKLSAVELPETLRSIGIHAFSSTALPRIVIPNGATAIRDHAFMLCRALRSVYAPSSVSEIGTGVFELCHEDLVVHSPRGSAIKAYAKDCGLRTDTHPASDAALEAIAEEAERERQHYSILPKGKLSRYYGDREDLVLPDGIKSVAEGAFAHNLLLRSVVIPDGVATIEENAFYGCHLLQVEAIGSHAFDRNGLEEAFTIHAPHGSAMEAYALEREWKVDDSPASASALEAASTMEEAISEPVHEAAVETTPNDFEIDPTGRLEVYKGSARSIILPKGLTKMDSCGGYERLISAIIPEGVEELGEKVFENCIDLESVSLPTTLKKIGSGAFTNCHHLRELTIPEGVAVIGRSTFSGCHNLRSIHLPGSLKVIEESAFADCAQLTGILIPDGVREIGRGAFRNCARLYNVSIPGGAKRVERELFQNCRSLTDISVPEGVEEVCERAFQDCARLKSVTLPNTLKAIRSDAFYRCSELADIYAPASVSEIDESAFSFSPSLVVHAARGSAMEAYAKRKNYRLGPASPLKETGDGFVIDANGVLVAYKGCDAQITLPANITGIADKAFMRNQDIASVTVPEGIQEIGDAAFMQCYNLKRVSLPRSLNRIGDHAFAGCEQLSGIVIPEGVKTIASGAFSGCDELVDVSLSEGLESIEASAFRYCRKLERIRLPKSLRRIGNEAFTLSMRLKDVRAPASTIEIGKSVFDYTSKELAIHTPLGSSMDVYAKKLGLKVDNPPAAAGQAPRYSISFLRELWPSRTEEELKTYQREMDAMDPEQAEALVQVTRAHNEAKRDADRLPGEASRLTGEAPPEQSTVYRIAHAEHSQENPAIKQPDPNSRAARRQMRAAQSQENPEKKEPDPNSRAARRKKRNEERKRELQAEICKLEQERASLSGLFGGIKKVQLQMQINELKEQLRNIR